jgi:hypothetical protein
MALDLLRTAAVWTSQMLFDEHKIKVCELTRLILLLVHRRKADDQ